MKKLLSVILSISILTALAPCTIAAQAADNNANQNQIKNIIYLIPDGGGYGPYDFANMVKVAGGFNEEKFPNKTPTDTEPMSMRACLAGSMTTASASSSVTDSAAAGTAMATGYKTINGFVGIDKNLVPKANLVEAAESVGKATGIISTYHWSHATPATFTAHATDRGDDYNIYQQIENKGLEVVLGVGYGMVSQYATIQNAIDNGYTVVETKDDLLNVKPGDKIWGNIAEKNYPYDTHLGKTQATLAEMTSGAIRALSGDPDGFFLMVEGGKVDTGGHSNSALVTTSEYLAFDAAFKVALDFAKSRTDTVVVCGPDHDTGGMIIPDNPETAVSEVMDGTEPTSISWTTASHTGQNVGVWVYAPEGVELIEGLNPVTGDTQSTREDYIIDNTAIAPWCADFMGVNLDALSEELFVSVSNIGKYSSITKKFTFNNGDKYVYSNQDEYFKDGEKISTNGKTAFQINNNFYVPAEMVDKEDWNYVTEVEAGDGITGKGTASDPYILDDAYDFMEFTGNMISGMSYKGKYIRQTKDIDLTAFSDYHGIGDGATFAGIYDGNGKKITVSIASDADVSVFPKVTGVLMNVGTEGTIMCTKSDGYASGVAYYVGTGGKIINCYSNATIKSLYAAGGITTYNFGLVGNCSFCGALSGRASVPIGMARGDAYEFVECYYLKGVGTTSLDVGTATTVTQAKTQLADKLNSNRKGAAAKLGYSAGLMSYWTNDNGYPEHYVPSPTVDNISITPQGAVVDKGDGILLSATVTGQFNPSTEVTWSIEGDVLEGTTIASDGFLVIDKNETATSFGVMAKSKQDGGKAATVTITVGENTISEPDGTRARPYLIQTENDFKALCDGITSGNDYSGLYFRQTKNIDLADFKGYNGLDSNKVFAGFYDGAGYTVNIDIVSDTDNCLFPSVSGTVINLGVTGSVKNKSVAGAICSTVAENGKIVNCWSNAYIEGINPGGIASNNLGTVASCFFFGELNASSGKACDIAGIAQNSVNRNNFYIGNEYVESSHNSQVTASQLKDEISGLINLELSDTAKFTKLPISGFSTWYYADGILSFAKDNTMSVAPSMTVSLDGNTSIGTVYAIMYNADGTLCAVKEYKASQNVQVKFDANAKGAYVKIMWWHGNMYPMCAPQKISL
ncbi:MAG: alkaline phosphatase [Clostridia bacterium]|nr:alkaline phosphatase [Clostridia bacterium]